MSTRQHVQCGFVRARPAHAAGAGSSPAGELQRRPAVPELLLAYQGLDGYFCRPFNAKCLRSAIQSPMLLPRLRVRWSSDLT